MSCLKALLHNDPWTVLQWIGTFESYVCIKCLGPCKAIYHSFLCHYSQGFRNRGSAYSGRSIFERYTFHFKLYVTQVAFQSNANHPLGESMAT